MTKSKSPNEGPANFARPPAPYIGGKRLLAPLIAERIDLVPHHCYVEPFTGMGGVFFTRRRRARVEVINDISRDVTTLFRVAQRHFEPFIDLIRYQMASRSEFERWLAMDPETLTDLERAARFLYLQRTAFGGKVSGRSFGTSTEAPARFTAEDVIARFKALHARLQGVNIERLDWRQAIERYDSRQTLFYLDPPYWDCENDYGRGVFSRGDFADMAARLAAIAGGFMVSLNDVPGVRETFSAFHVETVETTYTVAGGAAAKAVTEVLIVGGQAEVIKALKGADGPLFA